MVRSAVALVFSVLCLGCTFEVRSTDATNGFEGQGGAAGDGQGAVGGSSGMGGAGGVDGLGGAGGVGVELPPCTPATERTDCPGTSCDPATMRCSTFKLASRAGCWTCLSDTDCESPDYRCVEMYFQGERIPNDKHGFCLQVALVEGVPIEVEKDVGFYEIDDRAESNCAPHLRTVLVKRRSLSGSPTRSYCGLREDLTTCFALRAFETMETCPDGTDAECPDGAICRAFGQGMDAVNCCTFECNVDRECPSVVNTATYCDVYCRGD